MRAVIVLLATLTLTAGCTDSPSGPDANDEPLILTRLRAEPYPFAYYSGLRDAQRLVIRDAAAWQDIWTSIHRTQSHAPALPAIDFQREMVIVAALGERSSGGYSIFVESAAASGRGVTISVRMVSPGPGCAVTLALTQPVDIARITRRDGAVTFSDRAEVQECR